RPVPALAPRIALRITAEPLAGERLAGEGTLDQVLADLRRLREMGAESVVLDPVLAHPDETLRPERAWRDLAAVAAHRKELT
ncbi:LLM class F420-dependent oxidoreductase, partial [Spirillospora sp. NPDC049652]